MPSQSFMQLFGILANMAESRQRRELSERQLSQEQERFKEAVRQFDAQRKDKKTADALNMLAKASVEARPALLQLEDSGFFDPQEMEAFKLFAAGQAVDPATLMAGAAQRGYANANPQQRATFDQEAASRVTTGMPMGQVGTSQMTGALATGGPPPGNLQQAGVTPEAFAQLSRDFVTRAGQGFTAIDAANANTAGSNARAQWAQLDLEERKLLATMGLKGMTEAMEANKPLTPQQQVDALRAQANILNDMNAAKSDNTGNIHRIRTYNFLSDVLGINNKIPDPSVPGAPGRYNYMTPQPSAPAPAPAPTVQVPPPFAAVPQPASPWDLYWRGFFPNRVPQ